jgi:hypothetical protein
MPIRRTRKQEGVSCPLPRDRRVPAAPAKKAGLPIISRGLTCHALLDRSAVSECPHSLCTQDGVPGLRPASDPKPTAECGRGISAVSWGACHVLLVFIVENVAY